MKLTVITPFFKVAPYIGRCAESLLSQTLEDIEFIFVDDASPDESRAVLGNVIKHFPKRNVRILTHPKNKGLPAARNTGLREAKGEFVYHCDSDDWLEKDMLAKMVETAELTHSDFVYCDFWMEFEDGSRYMGNPTYTKPEDMIKAGFLGGLMKYNVWNKLCRRSLYSSDILFPEGHGMGEDMTMIRVALRATQVAHRSEALYHYVKSNANAFSNTFSDKHLTDILYNASRTIRHLTDWKVKDIELYINFFKLNTKLPFLMSGDKAQFKLWKEWFPEANPYILQNKHLPIRTRIIQWMAAHGQYWGVSLYSYLVNKFYYGPFLR